MGCEHSKNAILDATVHDEENQAILALWNKFLRGECAAWRKMVTTGKTEGKTPPVYWMDDFQSRMVANISTAYPFIAMELNSRPLKVKARIVCGIMEFCLVNMVTYENYGDTEGRKQQLAKIGRHHCKWGVDDAAYITVENAMMDAMRSCLGGEFTPQFEVYLRRKYCLVKQMIQDATKKFEKYNRKEALFLREEAKSRIEDLRENEQNKNIP